MRVQRISLANIGRAMEGATKHQIKRCWRFCAKPTSETADAMRGMVAKLLKKRKKKLLIAVDWWTSRAFRRWGQRGAQGPLDADCLGQHHESRLRRTPLPQCLRGIAASGAARHDPTEYQGG